MLGRNQDLADDVLRDMTAQGLGPDQWQPLKSVWLRALNERHVQWSELQPALEWAVDEEKLFDYKPGGIAGLGSLAMTEAGYSRARGL